VLAHAHRRTVLARSTASAHDGQVERDLVELTRRLVAIDSVNPALVEGGAGEREIAAFVRAWAEGEGLEAEIVEATTGRPSAIVRARGTGGGRSLLLCAHLDTVGVEGMTDPFTLRVDGDRMHGRGAYDMKSGLATALLVCREARALGLAGDVIVAAVADEEHASLGVQEVLRSVGADAAIVTEPTELELTVAHKGFIWLEIEVTGQAAHGSLPELGVDAILKMGPILEGLAAIERELGERPHPTLGPGSLHASLIEGGLELSTYPDRCLLALERRTLPGETRAVVEREIEDMLDRCRSADQALVAVQRTTLVRDPFEVAMSAEIVQSVLRAATAELGAPPPTVSVAYWADSAFIAAAGIPTVLFGAGGVGAHASEEWASISEALASLRIVLAVAREICA
jgi:acetylornithine deacetylase